MKKRLNEKQGFIHHFNSKKSVIFLQNGEEILHPMLECPKCHQSHFFHRTGVTINMSPNHAAEVWTLQCDTCDNTGNLTRI